VYLTVHLPLSEDYQAQDRASGGDYSNWPCDSVSGRAKVAVPPDRSRQVIQFFGKGRVGHARHPWYE